MALLATMLASTLFALSGCGAGGQDGSVKEPAPVQQPRTELEPKQTAQPEGNPEQGLVFQPESVDLGQVPLGQKVSFKFEMKNAGDKPLNIESPRAVALEGC